MPSPLKVLLLGKDSSIFNRGSEPVIGDTRHRHFYYAHRLSELVPRSQVRVLMYSPASLGRIADLSVEELHLYGTGTRMKALFTWDLWCGIRSVTADGWRPTVISAQTAWEDGLVGLIAARTFQAKFVAQLHFNIFSPEWKAEQSLNSLRKTIASRVFRRADRIRVVSTSLKERLIRQLGIAEQRIMVAPVGVNFTPVDADASALRFIIDPRLEHRKLVLFVGRLCAQKNLDLWVKVARLVSDRCASVAFIVVGDGDERSRMDRAVEKAGLTSSFFFLGRKKHEDLAPIYAAADVFMLTSHYEGFGRVVLEAMFAGVPVVSTKCCGPEDLVEDSVSGYLTELGDHQALANAVSTVLLDVRLAAQMGREGRRRAEQEFSLGALTDRIIATWRFE